MEPTPWTPVKLEEKTERSGRTPLHLVVIGCHDSIIAARRAAKHGTSLAAKSQAIQAKFVRVLAYMLHQGAIVDRQDAGAQSLQAKPAACTLSLLTYCPCSLPPAVGATPVHYAAAFGLQKVLGHLLSADDSDDQLNAEDAGNLLSNANPYAHAPAPPSQARFAHTPIIYLCLCLLRCAEGNTPMHYAYANEQAGIVQALEDRNADSSVRNAKGQMPVDTAGDSAIRALCTTRHART
jgi:hypothetical protein